jgi:AGZA family xanthine/uracil permease-like MFS transporter
MDKFFQLSSRGTNIRTEFVAGLTTFFTMAYIISVNPDILAVAGMNWHGVFVATILASVVGTLIMGLVANVPYAVAPGMGLNAFFAFTICGVLGYTWQEALAMVFICGIINVIITVTKLRKIIIKSIPQSLQLAIGGGIGLFIAYIGIKNTNFINFISESYSETGFSFGVDVVPVLSNFASAGPLLGLIGLIITCTLLILRVRTALILGIVATTLIGIPMGITELPRNFFEMSTLFDGFREVSFAFWGGETGIHTLFNNVSRLPIVLISIFAFSLSDTFDTIGTFIGTGRKSGIFDAEDEKALETSTGFKSRMDKALFADSTATSIGAILGTSNATTYIESAAGIGIGGRTGLTSIVVSAMFLLCLPFAAIFGMVPAQATAPILIVVGLMMTESFAGINWRELDEAIPCFFTIVIMAFAYDIAYGIAAGFIFYCLIKLCKRQITKVHPIIIAVSLLFLMNFVLQAVIKDGNDTSEQIPSTKEVIVTFHPYTTVEAIADFEDKFHQIDRVADLSVVRVTYSYNAELVCIDELIQQFETEQIVLNAESCPKALPDASLNDECPTSTIDDIEHISPPLE